MSEQYLLQLCQEQSQVGVRDQFRPSKQRIQVKPLIANTPNREPVLAVVANERTLTPADGFLVAILLTFTCTIKKTWDSP